MRTTPNVRAGTSSEVAGPNLIIVNGSPMSAVGGVQIFSRALARYAVERGYRTTIVTAALAHEPFRSDDGRSTTTYRMRCIPFLAGRVPVPYSASQIATVAATMFRARRALLVVQTRLYPLGLLTLALGRLCGARCVVIEHGSGHIPTGRRLTDGASIAFEHVVTAAMRALGARFFGVSPMSAAWLAHFGIRDAPVVTNGVDDTLFDLGSKHAPGRPFVVVFSGRLIPEKGVGHLLAAIRALRTRRPHHYRFEIIGEGPLLGAIADAAAEGADIIVHGPLTHDAALHVVARADAFVSPTTYPEGFNRGLIEAGALERPIVATFKGATDLLNDGVTALVVPPGDPHAIADALERLREDPALGRRLATAMARAVRAEHRWSTIFDRFLACAGAHDAAPHAC